MNKVYLVVSSWVDRCGEDGTDVKAFSTEKAAEEYFHQCVRQERNEDHLYNEDGVVEEYDEHCRTFSVYVDGSYSENHYIIYVKEVLIEE